MSNQEQANKVFSILKPLGYKKAGDHICIRQSDIWQELPYALITDWERAGTGNLALVHWNVSDRYTVVANNNEELITALASQRKDGPYQKGEWLFADWRYRGSDTKSKAIIRFTESDDVRNKMYYSEGYLWTATGYRPPIEKDYHMIITNTKYRRATAEEIINYFTNLKPKSNNPQQSVEQTTTTMQTISRIGLESIYNVACSSWKNKIQEMGKRNVFSSEITLTDSEVEEMFKAASADQKVVLRKFFKEPEQEFNANNLQPGEMMQSNSSNSATVYVLRVHNTLVGFNKLGQHTLTWDHEYGGFKGKKLASGSEFTLTVK